MKPKASSQGKGIFITDDISEVLRGRSEGEKHYVVSEYIINPYLINGYKFDLRIYVLITGLNPLKIYLYQDGLARFCAEKYTIDDLRNRFAHLTNYSINKFSKRFKVHDDDLDPNELGSKCLISNLKVKQWHHIEIYR